MGQFFICFASSVLLGTRAVMEIKEMALGHEPFANRSFFSSLVLALTQGWENLASHNSIFSHLRDVNSA